MLFPEITPAEKRKNFRAALKTGKLLRFPGSWSPLVSMEIEKQGFDGVYISGSVLSNDLGYPDIGLTTLAQVLIDIERVSKVTRLPLLVDADTGFEDISQTVKCIMAAGAAGLHLEDQISQKRCGQLEGKQLVSTQEMIERVQEAVSAKEQADFMIMARTDAISVEGLESAFDVRL